MAGLLYDDGPNGLLHFALLTVLGAAAAVASGRAIAGTWRAFTILPAYMLLLSAVLRFLHYALFGEYILSLRGFVVAFLVTLAAAGYGYRAERSRQMATQYSWLYTRAGPLGWTAKTL